MRSRAISADAGRGYRQNGPIIFDGQAHDRGISGLCRSGLIMEVYFTPRMMRSEFGFRFHFGASDVSLSVTIRGEDIGNPGEYDHALRTRWNGQKTCLDIDILWTLSCH
jgi:hypothetical protein